MLAVHWTPVNNTKHILKEGISKSKNGVYCFPLTGHSILDKWWVNFFNRSAARHRKSYNGIVFRISEEDLPAYFGHWLGATNKDNFQKTIHSLAELGQNFRETIIWRMGEAIAYARDLPHDQHSAIDYQKLGEEVVASGTKEFMKYYNDVDSMGYTFEDYQIVLSNPIAAKRIIKVLPQGNEFGKALRKQKLEKSRGYNTDS